MLARIFSCALIGLEGVTIEVETDASKGLPKMIIVGLPDAAVQESRERVESAIRNSGFTYPRKRLTINLAPASVRKEGPVFDLPIALGVLASSGQIPQPSLADCITIGELSLDGHLRHVKGILPITAYAKQEGFKSIIVPEVDAEEAALIPDIEVIPASTLQQLCGYLRGELNIERKGRTSINPDLANKGTDFKEIKSQEHAKRALEIAAAGGHNLLMIGPPGSGKTLLARALPGILPSLSLEEALDVTRVYSIADLLPNELPLIQTRPFRSPHHTTSHAGMVGGGNWPHPGEVSLAHRGVLFLDEFPEFSSRVLEVLRQPLEDKLVTISRAAGSLTFPANFQLIAAMNPCPCGFYGDPIKPCTCSHGSILKYQKRISGPMLDRIDIHIEVPRVEYEKLSNSKLGEPSLSVQQRVENARIIQRERFQNNNGHKPIHCNADMELPEIRKFCKLNDTCQNLLKSATIQLQLSARAYHRIIKLSRTIADLAGDTEINTQHLAEAIQYRPRILEI